MEGGREGRGVKVRVDEGEGDGAETGEITLFQWRTDAKPLGFQAAGASRLKNDFLCRKPFEVASASRCSAESEPGSGCQLDLKKLKKT